MNFENSSDEDWDEFERKLANEDGATAKAHLAAADRSTIARTTRPLAFA